MVFGPVNGKKQKGFACRNIPIFFTSSNEDLTKFRFYYINKMYVLFLSSNVPVYFFFNVEDR